MHVGRQVVVLGRVADARAHLGAGAGGVVPEHPELAVVGRARPRTSPRSVVLPAPFAPSSPVMPPGTEKVAPSSAVVAPKRRVSATPSTTVVDEEESAPMGGRA